MIGKVMILYEEINAKKNFFFKSILISLIIP